MHRFITIVSSIATACMSAGCAEPSKPTASENRNQNEGAAVFEFKGAQLFEATATDSAERVAKLLPTKPSEDASSVLGKIRTAPIADEAKGEREYGPNEQVEWVVTAEFSKASPLQPRQVAELFDEAWRDDFAGITIYGRDADSKRWTFLISADGPKAVTELKFAWNYVDPLDDKPPISTASLFEERSSEIRRKLTRLGEVTLTASLPPQEAAMRARELWKLKSDLDYTAVVILAAPQPSRFDGRDIWDVMLCLGVTWGDMDCFHWSNTTGEGDDSLFSVQTSTPPGYFLPEQIAAGQVHVDDLVFLYSVPRCVDPVGVFDAMTRAILYSHKRLGGEILDGDGQPADLTTIRSQILNVDRQLRDADLAPGSDAAMQIF